MITLFRRIRQKLIDSGKVTTYLLYASGEILLVVVGILIALQVNNWNQERLASQFEYTMLKELELALESDSSRIVNFIEPRLVVKEKAIDSLLNIASREVSLSGTEFMDLYGGLTTKLEFNYNSGPYETMKSNGLDLITNDVLRERITHTYEVAFPVHQGFLRRSADTYTPMIKELEIEFMDVMYETQENDRSLMQQIPSATDVLNHASFKRVAYYEQLIAEDYRSRLDFLKQSRTNILRAVRDELRRRGDG